MSPERDSLLHRTDAELVADFELLTDCLLGGPVSTMEEDHARDMNSGRRLLALRDELEAFLADPPYRARTSTEETARGLLASVRQDMAHIVQAWD